MDPLTNPVQLKIELPKITYPDAPGGGWPLKMDSVDSWAWMSKAFSNEELDLLIKIGESLSLDRATTFSGINKDIRNSFVTFMFPNEVTSWVFQKLAVYINDINSKYFGFDLYGMEQGLQFTRYEAPGEHYEWHVDKSMGIAPRKLSLSIQLSDPADYDGGDLEMWFGGEPIKAARERGMITFFPSYVLHRVTPVTRGTRYSLVCWVGGPNFK